MTSECIWGETWGKRHGLLGLGRWAVAPRKSQAGGFLLSLLKDADLDGSPRRGRDEGELVTPFQILLRV